MTPIDFPITRHHRPGVRRMIKHNLKVDMTPMVDLGFLLIAFFVITTELTRPTAMNLAMPKDGPPSELGVSNALTVLLDRNDVICYYYGDWQKAEGTGKIFKTDFSARGLRKIINDKQKYLDRHNTKEGRNGLMMLIKPASGASYKNVVDVLDEATISAVKKYAIIKITPAENKWMEKAGE